MSLRKFNVLGVGVSAIDMSMAVATIDKWIVERRREFVCLRDVHGIMACRQDAELREIHGAAGLVCPDGMPLVWMAHRLGFREVARVCGPDLMLALCAYSLDKNYRHFLYGGAPGVVEELADALRRRFPGLRIVGTHSPPFRPLSEAEDADVVRRINASQADMVWVGLGSPRQERWMAAHVGRLEAPVLLGVGAAFDWLAGRKRRAPRWMRRSGLEWLHRLVCEPRRLWRRYVLVTPRFLPLAALQVLGSWRAAAGPAAGRERP